MKKMLMLFTILVVMGLMATSVWSQQVNDKSTVLTTAHNISGQGCASCHVPHQASARGETLLWAQPFSTQIFGVYDTGTMDNKATEIGDATYSDTNPPSGSKQSSVLCMSCHDGVTSPTLIGPSDGHAIGNPTNSDGLRNDHPINMNYDPAMDPGLNPVATVTATNVRLFGGTVQCASCHDPHNAPGLGDFLREDNANSALCIKCHK